MDKKICPDCGAMLESFATVARGITFQKCTGRECKQVWLDFTCEEKLKRFGGESGAKKSTGKRQKL